MRTGTVVNCRLLAASTRSDFRRGRKHERPDSFEVRSCPEYSLRFISNQAPTLIGSSHVSRFSAVIRFGRQAPSSGSNGGEAH